MDMAMGGRDRERDRGAGRGRKRRVDGGGDETDMLLIRR
jgi:hypothetical protein